MSIQCLGTFTFFIGEKSRVRLQRAPHAAAWITVDSSYKSFNNGVATPASTRLVLKLLTLRDRDLAHWHAANRTWGYLLCNADTT